MDSWKLPTSLNVGGNDYKIRTDYRVILDILAAMNDPDIFEPGMSQEEMQQEKVMTMLQILYIDFDSIPPKNWKKHVILLTAESKMMEIQNPGQWTGNRMHR